jgi:membrane-bound serine protease (ClpP class)
MIVAFVVLLMVVGLGLLAVEIVVLPGFGLVGLLGLGALGGAGALAFSELGPGAAMLAVGGGVGAAGLMFWLLPKTRAGRSMVLAQAVPKADLGLDGLVGQVGQAVTPLRPAGSIRVADRVIDVVAAEGAFVDAGAVVRVVKVEGARVVVEAGPEMTAGA